MSVTVQTIAHTVVSLGLLAAAATLTALGHDGTPYFGALAGYLGAAAVGNAPTKTTTPSSPSSPTPPAPPVA